MTNLSLGHQAFYLSGIWFLGRLYGLCWETKNTTVRILNSTSLALPESKDSSVPFSLNSLWNIAMKKSHYLYASLIGGLGGLLSWLLMQIILNLQTGLGYFPLLDRFVYEGIVLGTGIGMTLYSKEVLIQNQLYLLPRSAGIGAIAGAISGFLGFFMGHSFLALSISVPLTLIHIFSWALLSGWLGVCMYYPKLFSKEHLARIGVALIGGAIGGLLFELFRFSPLGVWGALLGMILIGLSLSIAFNFFGIWMSQNCIRILTGYNAGQTYLLDRDSISIGYLPKNDIVLKGYSEVCETHAIVQKSTEGHTIVNDYPGGQVFVNYRLIDEQSVKHGDIIKIGSALLQYYEV